MDQGFNNPNNNSKLNLIKFNLRDIIKKPRPVANKLTWGHTFSVQNSQGVKEQTEGKLEVRLGI
jgi:hypothetical protein